MQVYALLYLQPSRGPERIIHQAAADPNYLRRELTLKQGQGSGSYCPGNYGFLDVNGQNGANVIEQALAALNPGTCYVQSNVTTEPGNIASASDALNVRFDIYQNSANKFNNASYPSALNVRKGYYSTGNGKGSSCPINAYDPFNSPPFTATWTPVPAYPYEGFGHDFATVQTTCGSTVGNGQWDFDGYWTTNHNYSQPPPPKGQQNTPAPNNWACNSATYANPPSRYQVYQKEIGKLINDSSPGCPTGVSCTGKGGQIAGETGGPTCNTNKPPANVDRRIVYAAIIDCQALQAEGFNFNGRTTDIPVETFANFFLTRPVDSSNTVYAELVGLVQPDTADEQRIIGVAVVVSPSRSEDGRMFECDGEQFVRGPNPGRVLVESFGKLGRGDIVEQAAPHLKELADGDVVAIENPGNIFRDRIVEAQFPFLGQQHDHGGRHRRAAASCRPAPSCRSRIRGLRACCSDFRGLLAGRSTDRFFGKPLVQITQPIFL